MNDIKQQKSEITIEQNDQVNAIIKRLQKIVLALDDYLGDTDPDFPEDMTDEEIREEEPIFWACKELSSLILDLRNRVV